MRTTLNCLLIRGAGTSLALLAFLPATIFAHAINGAIYSSTADHVQVNANQYDDKEDVYLNGGPGNFPQCNGGKLTDGEYYFQVTNPSGSLLLSTTGIEDRKFQVSGGVISLNLGTHASGGISPCGSLAIQLFPFEGTDNAGGVYKIWITWVADYDPEQGVFGFVPGHTKTDNFKVAEGIVDPVVGAIEACKFYDADADGDFGASEELLADWEMTLESVEQGIASTRLTDEFGCALFENLVEGDDYFVEEGTPVEGNWVHSATIYVGHDGSPQNPAGPLAVVANETASVIFGNFCEVPSNGRTLGFWSNPNGRKLITDNGYLASVVNPLNLRNANGSFATPFGNVNNFRSWLLGANATNMAYMLSAQLAAMALNVGHGFVDGDALYAPYGGTISALIDEANASLGDHGLTLAGHPERDNQEALKNHLDALNNGAGVVSPAPCDYSFE